MENRTLDVSGSLVFQVASRSDNSPVPDGNLVQVKRTGLSHLEKAEVWGVYLIGAQDLPTMTIDGDVGGDDWQGVGIVINFIKLVKCSLGGINQFKDKWSAWAAVAATDHCARIGG